VTAAAPRARSTAFVLAGGGSLGAVQVGMLKALARHGLVPDLIVGASVGAINGVHFAFEPDRDGVASLERVWSRLSRRQVFPFSPISSLLGYLGRRSYLVDPSGLRSLLASELEDRRLEFAQVPCYVVATDLLDGSEVVTSSGPAVPALIASAAIPAIFPPALVKNRYLVDGGVSNNTPISTALRLGADRIVVLPTGMACALEEPPRAAMAVGLHALNLLVMQQLVSDVDRFRARAELIIVPPLCPMKVSPYDSPKQASSSGARTR
jgi:NTE family protein